MALADPTTDTAGRDALAGARDVVVSLAAADAPVTPPPPLWEVTVPETVEH